MLRPLTMKHVTIQALTLDLPAAALILAELGVFDPDARSNSDEALPDNPGRRYRELHRQALGRLEKLGSYLGPPTSGQGIEPRAISEADLADTNDWLGRAWQVCSQYEEDKRALLDREREIEQLQSTLDNFSQLDIDLGLLQEKRRFLDIHIGSVPLEHVRHLRDAVSLDGYLLFIYMENRDRAHVVIIGPGEARSQHLVSVLDTAGYRAFELPPELHAKPEQVAHSLAIKRADLRQQLQQLEQRFSGWRRMAKAEYDQATRRLKLATPYVALGESAHNRGNLAQVRGWVPAADIENLQQTLQHKLAHPFVLQARDPRPEEHRLVPSVLRHSRWLQAFA
ncbi:MAG: ATPase, partial [Chromatiales bacterium]